MFNIIVHKKLGYFNPLFMFFEQILKHNQSEMMRKQKRYLTEYGEIPVVIF